MSTYVDTYTIDLPFFASRTATRRAADPAEQGTSVWAGLTLRVASVVRASRDRMGATDRRLRRIEADPTRAAAADIELLVRAHGVPEQQVWDVVDRLDDAQIDATLAWMWTTTFDGTAFAELCTADLSDGELSARLERDLQDA